MIATTGSPQITPKWKSENWRPIPTIWRPDIFPISPIPPGRAPRRSNPLRYLARSLKLGRGKGEGLSQALKLGCLGLRLLLALSSWLLPCSALVLLLLLLGEDGVGAEGWGLVRSGCCYCWSCWCDWACWRGVCAVVFRFVGVAGTAPALGGTVDAVGGCSDGTAAAAAAAAAAA
eukprot:176014-Pelagomonas_calceolata.AAC.1